MRAGQIQYRLSIRHRRRKDASTSNIGEKPQSWIFFSYTVNTKRRADFFELLGTRDNLRWISSKQGEFERLRLKNIQTDRNNESVSCFFLSVRVAINPS